MIHHEVTGRGDPVMLISGLSGVGRAWGDQVERFASEFLTIIPDHPGTGSSPQPEAFTIDHHAAAMAEVLRTMGCGPTHLVGSSTGGAVAQVMALDHPDVVRSIALVSSWAGADPFFRHQFAVRRDILTRLGPRAYAEATALFLFSPDYIRHHYPEVRRWCDSTSDSDPEVMAARIDMILAYEQRDRLGEIAVPTLVLVGAQDGCTPPHFSQELADRIPGAELAVLEGGHLIYKEAPEAFHARVRTFLVAS